MRPLSCLVTLLVALPGSAQQHIAPTNALSPEAERKSFTVLAGFAVQLVAAEPDIEKPMQIAWDARGRLWVTTSHHYPFPAAAGQASDKVYILSDFGVDGQAKTIKVFAKDLNIPIGILPMPDGKSMIVSSVGEILKYTDTDNDGVADKREVLFTGFGTRDTHGMTNSFTFMPDGWVYACHGFNNQSTVKGKDGHEVTMHSGHTFRFRPDGSRIEVYTRGQVNPFGMTTDSNFNLYTADCHTKPITQLIPGAYYDSFGKPHDGLGYGPHATPHDHGSTALCGLAWYEAEHFPRTWMGCMFLGNVVTNRINADRFEWKGSSPNAKELPDFLTSTDPWFRPTDIKLGPDGALYVADFYNKIIGHYEVDLKHPQRDKTHGRLWRIVWVGNGTEPKLNAVTNLAKTRDEDLWLMMGNANITTRIHAIHELNQRGIQAIPVKTMVDNQIVRDHSLWLQSSSVIQAMGKEQFVKMAENTLKQPGFEATKTIFLNSLAREAVLPDELRGLLWTNWQQYGPSTKMALLKLIIAKPNEEYVKPLQVALPTIPAEDTHLRQAGKIALRNCLKSELVWPKPETEQQSSLLITVALGSEGAPPTQFLLERVLSKKVATGQLASVMEYLGRHRPLIGSSALMNQKFATNPETYTAVAAYFRGAQTTVKLDKDKDSLRVDLDDFFRQNSDEDPSNIPWILQIVKQASPAIRKEAKRDSLAVWCLKLVDDAKNPNALRAEAMETALQISPQLDRSILHAYVNDVQYPLALKEKVAASLANSKAITDQAVVIEFLKIAPYRTANVIATALARDRASADLLFSAIRAGKASPRLLQEKAVLDALAKANVPELDKKIAELTQGLPSPDTRLAALIKTRATMLTKVKGDAGIGKTIYTKSCAACHRIGDEGGKVGPNLDGIGTRGLDRLLEDTLDPNRNVDAAFRATRFEMKDGRQVMGLLLRVEGVVNVVSDAEGKELRINKSDVEKQETLASSPMPTDVAEKLKDEEFAHLMAYLLSVRNK